MKYRKMPVVIEAVQWKGNNLSEIEQELDAKHTVVETIGRGGLPTGCLTVYTLEGPLSAQRFDWIIKGVKGECYPCKPDVFMLTYDLVADVGGRK